MGFKLAYLKGFLFFLVKIEPKRRKMGDFEYPKFYKHGILFVGLKTLGTSWLQTDKCSNLSTNAFNLWNG